VLHRRPGWRFDEESRHPRPEGDERQIAQPVQQRSSGRKRRVSGPRKRPPLESPLDGAKAYEVVWQQVADIFELGRQIKNPLFVYFIGEGEDGPVKIGLAKDPFKRVRGMQTGNSRRLRVEHAILGDRAIEHLLHEMWKQYAIVPSHRAGRVSAHPGTEWFEAEIRDKLYPVIPTIVEKQREYVFGAIDKGEDLTFAETERALREAHGAHGVVAHRPHETRLLGKHAGYVARGRSLI
jgi:hypothetical protein